jgi:predicted unusual protein kinase regulating ubiquinone biosynthesis (AarF/ABC1/UbiB family)
MSRPATGGSRLLKLAGMTASVAGRYAGSKIKSIVQSADAAALARAATNARNGEAIARTLGELKGAVMKVGQMASIAGDVLPKELASALATLQRDAPPMPFETIAAQIEAELGGSPDRLFERFDREPFAAASIGQVHRARVDGREVVVKVQYPGVDASADSDLAHLKVALRASGLVKVPKEALDALFVELRDRLIEELDYAREAENARLFRAFHAERHPFVVVPEVIDARSTKRVLALAYEPGDTLGTIRPGGYSQALRDRIGEHLTRAFLAELFELQAIHADPNPANFAARLDGTLVVYDFGCVKRVPDEVMMPYRATLKAAIEEDYAGVERGMLELGVRRPAGPPVEASFYKAWRDIFAPAVFEERYDFGTTPIPDQVMKQAPKVLERMGSFQPAAQIAYIDRAIAGHFGNLRNLGVRGSFGPILRGYLV